MVTVLSAGTVSRSEDDTWYDVRFGNFRNVLWVNPSVTWGTASTKSGQQNFLGATFRFSNVAPTIPPGSKIETAVLKGTAAANQSGTQTTLIEVMAKDGTWDGNPVAPAQWRKIDNGTQPGDFRVEVRDTGAGVMTTSDIGTGNNFNWALRSNPTPGRYEQLGESMTVETAGALGEIDYTIRAIGSPTGLIFLQVYDRDGDGFPGTLLATSDTIDVSTIAAAYAPVTFAFSGGDQIAMALNDEFVVVIRGDWAVSATDHIECRYKLPGATQGGYTLGNAMTFGIGAAWDDQNYPTDLEIIVAPSAHPSVFGFWPTPNFVEGVEYTTIDFAALMQAYVNSPGYSEGDPFAVQLSRFSAAQISLRSFKSFDHADTPGISNQITLEVEWSEPVLERRGRRRIFVVTLPETDDDEIAIATAVQIAVMES